MRKKMNPVGAVWPSYSTQPFNYHTLVYGHLHEDHGEAHPVPAGQATVVDQT